MNILQFIWLTFLISGGIVLTVKMFKKHKSSYSVEVLCSDLQKVYNYLNINKIQYSLSGNTIVFNKPGGLFSLGEIITIEFMDNKIVKITSRPKYGHQCFYLEDHKNNVAEISKFIEIS